jgi:hypothetical protein
MYYTPEKIYINKFYNYNDIQSIFDYLRTKQKNIYTYQNYTASHASRQ